MRSHLVLHKTLAAVLVGSFLAAHDAQSQATRDKLPTEYSACDLAGRLGIAVRASKLANKPVRDQDDSKVGKVQDLFLDLSSGQLLCVMVSTGGSGTCAVVPAKSFRAVDANNAVLENQTPAMSVAPRCAATADATAVLNLLPDSYVCFGQKNAAKAQVNAAQCCKSSELLGRPVKNADNAQLGTIADLILDVPTGRMLFAVISFAGSGTDLYAVPPAALRLASDRAALVLNAEKSKIAALAQSDGFFWANLIEMNTALRVYRDFGQQPDFAPSVTTDSDPAREQVRTKVDSATATTVSPPKSDSQIQNDILMAAMRDDVNNAVALQKVKIGCVNGHVTLTGRARNEKFRSRLNAIVAGVVGAANITDQLEVK